MPIASGPDAARAAVRAAFLKFPAFSSAFAMLAVNFFVSAVTIVLILATVVPTAIIVPVLSLAVAPAHAPNTQSGTERSIR